MNAKTPKGTYDVQKQAELVSNFELTKFTAVSSTEPAKKGRALTSDPTKKAKSDWQSIILTSEDGRVILQDGLKMAEQAVTDAEFRKEVYSTFEASIVDDKLVVENIVFKSEFTIGLVNRKYIC